MNDDSEWNISYYFNLHDQRNGVTAFMRIGSKPNKDEKSVFLFVIEKGRVCGIRNATPCDDDRRSCSGLSFTEEEGCWKIRYGGPLFDVASKEPVPLASSIDIDWKPVNPLMDYHDCVDAQGAEMSARTASEHFEQFGLATGRISVGDAVYEIEATGERDFSEGVRDWGSPKMWLWLNSVYGDDLGFNATKLSTQAGDVDAGYVGTAASTDPVVKIDADDRYDGGVPSSYGIRMYCRSGAIHDVEGRVLRHARLPMQGSKDMMLIETISETEMEGRTGYGIAEFLVPLNRRRGQGPAIRKARLALDVSARASVGTGESAPVSQTSLRCSASIGFQKP